jgi:hypothetical protein
LAFLAAFLTGFFAAFFFAAMCYLPDDWSTTNDARQRRVKISERRSTLQGEGRAFLAMVAGATPGWIVRAPGVRSAIRPLAPGLISPIVTIHHE